MKCPNCNEVELTADGQNGHYCSKCDITLAINKGKVIVENKKGKIQELEELVTIQGQELSKLKEALFGDKDVDLW